MKPREAMRTLRHAGWRHVRNVTGGCHQLWRGKKGQFVMISPHGPQVDRNVRAKVVRAARAKGLRHGSAFPFPHRRPDQ